VNVVFDLGGVLIEWDPRHLYRKVFTDESKMEWFLSEVCPPAWNLEQDRGRSFDDAVIEATTRYPVHAAEIAMFRDRWMEMVPGAIQGTVAVLEELHISNSPLYAITNWNGDTFRATRQRFGFLSLFKDIVVSGDEKVIKPDKEIFAILARRNGLKLEDSVFIDDSLKNVVGAKAAGMDAILFQSPDQLRAELAERSVL
jgi:2-haloacid dehalogenase